MSGTWTQPSASCSSGEQAYSAAWVGLGGYGEHSTSLEQVGTDADCSRSGRASYSAWYELLPAGPAKVPLTVSPGDKVSASVTVRNHSVTLRLRDLSTGGRFSTTRRASSVDTSSAEWIVEAPSACVTSTTCTTLPLADFGTTLFSNATATARRHTGTITDPLWSATGLELQQDLSASVAGRGAANRRLAIATPSTASAATGSFSVTWMERSVQPEQAESRTLPGLNGGPPP